MKIVSLVNRELTAEEVETIERFRTYTDGVSFACLRPRVMVMLHDEPSKDIDKLKDKAFEHMNQALSEHPDFSVYEMDDGRLLVFLNSGIFAFSAEPCAQSMLANLRLRNECLEAAEAMEITAIVYEEED